MCFKQRIICFLEEWCSIDKLTKALNLHSCRVDFIDLKDFQNGKTDAFHNLISEQNAPPISRVIYLTTQTNNGDSLDLVFDLCKHRYKRATIILSACLEHQDLSSSKFMVVTNNVFTNLNSNNKANIIDAGLWGLASVLSLEHPGAWGGIVDCNQAEEESLASVLLDDSNNDQWKIHQSNICAARLSQGLPLGWPEISKGVVYNGTYLLAGGLSGLGVELCNNFLENGAEKLFLLGRKNPIDLTQKECMFLKKNKYKVEYYSVDISQSSELSQWFEHLSNRNISLDGVFNLAMSAFPKGALDYSDKELENILEAKIRGTILLHKYTQSYDLKYFVCFSSASSVIGAKKQGAYAFANQFMDRFMFYRRSLGLVGSSISLGWVLDIGGVSRDVEYQEHLRKIGFRPIEVDLIFSVLGDLVVSESPHVMLSIFDQDYFPLSYEVVRQRGLFDFIRGNEQKLGSTSELEHKTSLDIRHESVSTTVLSCLKKILGYSQLQSIDVNTGFFELGMDSLLLLQFSRELGVSFACEVDSAMLFEHSTPNKLINHLSGEEETAVELRPQLKDINISDDEPVAIVGMSGVMPSGANDLEGFWHNLESGQDCVGPMPKARLDLVQCYKGKICY